MDVKTTLLTALTQQKTTPSTYRSPYEAPPPAVPQEQNLKRPHSEVSNQLVEGDEKRQRVEIDGSVDSFLDAIINQASSNAIADAEVPLNATSIATASTNPPSQYAQRYSATMNGAYLQDPQMYMRWSSAPILDNLSSQILSLMVHGSYEETIGIFTNPQSDRGQQYHTLRSLLDQTTKMYILTNQRSKFLQAEKLHMSDEKYRATIWSTNLTILAAFIFGGNEPDWDDVHSSFLEILVPQAEELNREVGQQYLNFVTQMIISSVSAEEQYLSREEIFHTYFPSDLENRLIARHPGHGLTPVEQDLIRDCAEQQKFLEEQTNEDEKLAKLMRDHPWDDFLSGFFSYIKNTFGRTIPQYETAPENVVHRTDASQTYAQSNQDASDFDFMDVLNSAAGAALQAAGPDATLNATQQVNLYGAQYASGTPIVATQTKSTAELYEDARQQAANKNSSNNRRGTGGLSARRPWSSEEENALMAGLDQVKGPHWSQILSLYGQGGTISNILEHRNQVQLKDKARNLKLFFLKSGIEVPYFLSSVTGELKTRAPSQAARKELEERQKHSSDDSVARIQNILTIAGSSNGFPNVTETHSQPSSRESTQQTGTPQPEPPLKSEDEIFLTKLRQGMKDDISG